MITLVCKKVEEVDKWYNRMQKLNVKCLFKPKDIKGINIRAYLFEDPEGYTIEIQNFYE